MIPCNHCGTDNNLGTMFCRSCGQRIEVDPNAIMASVQHSASEDRSQKLFLAARNALGIATFLFAVAMILRFAVIADLPQQRMPAAESRTGVALLPAMDQGDTAPAGVALTIGSGSGTLVDWRLSNASHVLGSMGLDFDQIRSWQQLIIEKQKPDGSFLGSNPYVSTATSVLALQAFPGATSVDRAAKAGSDWLYARRDRVFQSSDRIAQALLGQALLETGRLNITDLGTLAGLIGSGERLEWQAVALPLFSNAKRPTDILVLQRKLADQELWRYYLDSFSPKPLVTEPSDSLFTPAGVITLDPFQRWVWAQTAWFHAADAEFIAATLRSWNSQETLPDPPEPLATEMGPQAGAVLAVLAVSAPIRAPAIHAKPPRK
ncbi:MAG: zinc ribbon domain-containing protein [Planctomycetota bacterium]|jgi:hypothetical protein|nr:zinc ribbon domain-containing protein [Planctomycetota bacterium]